MPASQGERKWDALRPSRVDMTLNILYLHTYLHCVAFIWAIRNGNDEQRRYRQRRLMEKAVSPLVSGLPTTRSPTPSPHTLQIRVVYLEFYNVTCSFLYMQQEPQAGCNRNMPVPPT